MALSKIAVFALFGAWSVGIVVPAYAEQVELFCHQAGSAEGVGLNVSIDMGASTVTEWPSGASRGDGGTQTATITSDQVSWTWVQPSRTFTMTLDRQTGALKQWWDYSPMGSMSLTCVKASPVF